ncbi:stage III sporulation protein AG [Bacillus fengqiuensis]|nr:stage III sporulation protein AG [Bacillus fengqiuensis]
MDNPFTRHKNKILKREGSHGKKTGKNSLLLVLILFGTTIMLMGNLLDKDNSQSNLVPTLNQKDGQEDSPAFNDRKSPEKNIITGYEDTYEAQLKDLLEDMLGVNNVTVFVNVDATEKKIFEKNAITQSQTTEETDREGGKRTVEDISKDEQVVIIRNGDKEEPIIVEIKKPIIRGVAIVAKGAENIHVKKSILEAVTRSLDVPSHRVSIMPKKSN